MIENTLQKCEDDDPNRCQSIGTAGQCHHLAIENTIYCRMHGGNKQEAKNIQTAVNNYRLNKYQARVSEFAQNNSLKSLREEIGILRLVLEETMNRCKDDTDIIVFSPKISDLVMKIEKLVVSCHRLEGSLGTTLDKTIVLNLSQQIVAIVAELVPDEQIIDTLVSRIGAILQK